MNTTQLSKLQNMVGQFHQSNLTPKNGATPVKQKQMIPFPTNLPGADQTQPQGPNRPPSGNRFINAGKQGMQLGTQPPNAKMGSIPIMNTPSSAAMQTVKSPMMDMVQQQTQAAQMMQPQQQSIDPAHQQFMQSAIQAGYSPDMVMQFMTHKLGLNRPNPQGGN